MCGQTPQQMVREFHERFGCAIDHEPTQALRDFRVSLIVEEALEVSNELLSGRLLAIAKELADLVYVTYGTAVSLGIDLDQAVAAVHESNMSKLSSEGKPLLREDGKVLKGPDYQPPDMTPALGTRHAS